MSVAASLIGVAMNSVRRLLLLVLLFPLSAFTQEAATVTMVEGGLRLIRGTSLLQGAESMRLRAGDIMESADSGFVQLEFPGGVVVALGPGSHVLLLSDRPGRDGDKARAMVLLSGWLKGELGPNAGTYRFLTPALAVTSREGSVLVHAGTPSEIFVESGSAVIAAVKPDGNLGETTPAKAGQFISRRAGKSIATAPRPDPNFINAMPRYFRDTLPSRYPRFAGKRPAEPRREHEVTYPEIQPWLTAGYAWRRGFVQRFEPRLNDAEFRRAVEAHVGEHPEWDRILHPEKYQPKTPPASNPEARQDRE
jgi:hypothetical protein